MTKRTINRRRTGIKAVWAYPKYWALCFIASAISSVSAGTVEQAIILVDPQMKVKDGAVQGCGYRLKAIPKSFAGQTSFIFLDASFNLYSPGYGLLKGGAMQIEVKDGKFQAAARQADSFWLKVQGDSPTTAVDGRVLPSESKGYLLYAVSADSIARLFAGMAVGMPFTIGVRLKGEGVDRIYSGEVQMSDKDREQGRQCTIDLSKVIEAANSNAGSGQPHRQR